MSTTTPTRYSAAFKRQAVDRLTGCANVTALAAELGIRRKFLYLWRAQLAQLGEAAFTRGRGRPPKPNALPTVGALSTTMTKPPAPTRPTTTPPSSAAERQAAALAERVALLERQLGQKQLEVDFLAATFAHVRGAIATPASNGATPSTAASKRTLARRRPC